MKKRIVALLIALCIAVGMIPVTANATQLDNGLEYKVHQDHIEITDYEGDANEVVIPAKIEGVPVTRIGDYAFSYEETLTSIGIPDSVTGIGAGAFVECSSLTSISIPDGVTEIGDHAFGGCSSLISVSIPDGVTEIEYSTFGDCSSLISVSIPDSVTDIYSYAFNGCSSLTSISIPESVNTIDEYAFGDCTGLTSICFYGNAPAVFLWDGIPTVFDGVTATAYYPVNNETWTEKVMRSFGGNIAWVPYDPNHVHAYSEVVTAPTCTEAGFTTYTCDCGESYVDDYTDALGHEYESGICIRCSETAPTSGTCGENLTWVLDEDGTLTVSGVGEMYNYNKVDNEVACDAPWFPYSSTAIVRIVIESGVTTIGDYAFTGCFGLRDVSISNTVQTIGDYAFWYSGIYSPENAVNENWQIVIPEGVTHIGEGAFKNCDMLDGVSLPNTLTSAEPFAFYYSSLKSVEIPGSLTVIPKDMFFGIRRMTSITLNEGIERIESGAFAYCTPSEIIIPTTVEYVGECAWGWCPLLDRFLVLSRNCEFHDDFYIPNYADPSLENFTKWTDFYSYPGTQRPQPSDTTLIYHDLPEFTDLPVHSFYFNPVLWAVDNGITSGATADTFNPGGACMRAQVVTFLWRAAGQPEPTSTTNPFVDVAETDFYYKAVLWAVEKGITNGADATHFNPFGICNRAQVVTFLYRAFGAPAVENSENPFGDVPAGGWYTAPVLWAVENGITNGLSADSFGPNSDCNRAQVVTFLYRAYN